MALFQPLRSLLSNSQQRHAVRTVAGTIALTSLVITSGTVVLRQLGALQGAELRAYDSLVRLRPDAGIDNRLLVVGIGEADIQTRQEYPVQDGTLARALQRLQRHQPRAIGLDIARDVPQGQERAALLQQLAQSDRIIAACTLSSAEDPGVPPPPEVPGDRIAFADLPQDPDGVIRRSILVSTPAPSEQPLPQPHLCNTVDPANQLISLSLSLALLYLQAEGITPQPTPNGEIQIGSMVFQPLTDQAGGYRQTGATDYQILLNYRSAKQAVQIVSLSQVLADQVDPASIKDRVVIIGYTSDIAKDIFYTPYSDSAEHSRTMPGALIHAQSVSQILSAALGQRPLLWYWAEGVEWLWIMGWGLVGGAIAWFARKSWLFVLSEGLAVGSLVGICYGLLLQGGWVPLVPSAIALMTTAVGVVLLDRATQAGYTQAIYEQVKEKVQVALKPTIEIDEVKRAQQVAEITESGHFQELMKRAKAIRAQRQRDAAQHNDEL